MNKVQNNSLLPVYLIAGEDELKRETVLKRLHERLAKMGDLSFNSESFSGTTCLAEDVITAANTLPFASRVRLVEVHDIEKLKKNDTEQLAQYLEKPCLTTVLALIGQKVDKRSKLYKAVLNFGKTAFIDCTPFARKDMNKVVRSMAVGHGITFTQGAASTLIDLVGTNTVALDAELKKLALSHRGSDPVNENEVLSMVSRTAEIKPWEFLDALSGRNAQRCIYLFHRMENVSTLGLLAMCTSRIRDLITTKTLVSRGEQSKLPTVLQRRDWQVKKYIQWAQLSTMKELIACLTSVRDAEQQMKSGTNQEEVFIKWMLDFCKKN